MKNITKKLVVLFSSLFLSANAFAGELSVSGSANASYVINGGVANNSDKGLGISNELMFSASGELDNGFTWNYFMELDGNDGGAHDNDDSQLKIGMGDLGTLYINDSEGGLSTETKMGIGAVGIGNDFANTGSGFVGNAEDVSGSGNIQYDMPADVLPFGIAASIAYVPNQADGDNNSYKNAGVENTMGATGNAATMVRVTAAPLDGLSIGADYKDANNVSGSNAQTYEAGGYFANYAIGNFEIGYVERYMAPGVQARSGTTNRAYSYIMTGIGVEFAVNDALSISYLEEESERKRYTGVNATPAAGASPFTKDATTFESQYIMVAYDIGGATVGLTSVESTNSDYTAGQDGTKTLATISMAF